MVVSVVAAEQPPPLVNRLGFWAAVLSTVLAVVAFAMAITTLPRSGPSCTFDTCVTYPYTDIADYFPRDYLWMVPATLLLFAVVFLVVCVHYTAAAERKPFSLTAVLLASMAAGIVGADYFIQLTVIQPSVLRGETDGLSLWSQYNPHGVFIALEAVGYLLLSAAFLFLAPVFTGQSRLERSLRWLFAGAFGLTVASLVVLVAMYGQDLEYRFEIFVISIDWTTLIITGVLLNVLFRRRMHEE